MVFAALAYFFDLIDDAEQSVGSIATMNAGFNATTYIYPLVKSLELCCGILLLIISILSKVFIVFIVFNAFVVVLLVFKDSLSIEFSFLSEK